MSIDAPPVNRTAVALERASGFDRLVLLPPPGKPPTLDHATLAEMGALLARLEQNPPRLLVVESASEKTFCAGANLDVLRETDESSIVPWVEAGHRTLARLEDLCCPVVAKVDGYALGGGLELALAADMVYATVNASFGLTEARLGFVPGWGGSLRLPERVGPARAKRMFFQSAIVSADEAARIGLADFVGTPGEVDSAVHDLAGTLAALSAAAIAGFKRILGEARHAAREANLRAETVASVACLREADTKARIHAFLSRKKK
jgi:enoyl-CoA hydratase